MTNTVDPIDGRVARSQRTRSRIVEAVHELIKAGDLCPTTTRIAERAQVAERTLFVHFVDLEELYAAVAQHNITELTRDHRPVPADDPFPDRVASFVRQRAALLEALSPFRRAARRFEPESAALQDSRRFWVELGRRELGRVFACELAKVADPDSTLAAADVVTSWESWNKLRTDGRLGRRAANQVMVLALSRLLEP